MTDVPRFENPFLEDVAIAFRKRRKSLSHRATLAEYAKVYELISAERVERLEIHLDEGTRMRGAVLRLHAWTDRTIWLDARRSTKTGWAWEWSYDGRLLGKFEGRDVIAALEATYSTLHGMSASHTHALDQPWKQLLGRGPVEVR